MLDLLAQFMLASVLILGSGFLALVWIAMFYVAIRAVVKLWKGSSDVE